MRDVRRRVAETLTVAALVASTGCSQALPSADQSTAEAKVSGTVLVHDKPMQRGEITFNPMNAARKDAKATTVPVKSDGTFELTTLVGHNVVRISGPDVKKEPTLGYVSNSVDLKSGANKITLDFPAK